MARPGDGSRSWRMTFSPGPASFIRGLKSASPSNTRGGSRVPEWGPLGSVRGALSNERPYRDPPNGGIKNRPTILIVLRFSPNCGEKRPCCIKSLRGTSQPKLVEVRRPFAATAGACDDEGRLPAAHRLRQVFYQATVRGLVENPDAMRRTVLPKIIRARFEKDGRVLCDLRRSRARRSRRRRGAMSMPPVYQASAIKRRRSTKAEATPTVTRRPSSNSAIQQRPSTSTSSRSSSISLRNSGGHRARGRCRGLAQLAAEAMAMKLITLRATGGPQPAECYQP